MNAEVAIWDDDVLCGRIDVICGDCYEDGERTHRPIEPPYNNDGELLWHIVMVDCPHCNFTHEAGIGDSIGVCPTRTAEGKTGDDVVYDIDDDIIVERGV